MLQVWQLLATVPPIALHAILSRYVIASARLWMSYGAQLAAMPIACGNTSASPVRHAMQCSFR